MSSPCRVALPFAASLVALALLVAASAQATTAPHAGSRNGIDIDIHVDIEEHDGGRVHAKAEKIRSLLERWQGRHWHDRDDRPRWDEKRNPLRAKKRLVIAHVRTIFRKLDDDRHDRRKRSKRRIEHKLAFLLRDEYCPPDHEPPIIPEPSTAIMLGLGLAGLGLSGRGRSDRD